MTYNGRVQRTVGTLSQLGPVVLFTSGGSERDRAVLDPRVELRPVARPKPSGLRKWVLLHRQNDQLADAALASDRDFDVVWANDYSTLFPARRIAHETGARLVYDSHELWLETVNQFFPTDAPPPKALAFRMIVGLCRMVGNWEEPRLIQGVDVLITVNESYAKVLRDRFDREEVAVVLNCPRWTEVQRSDRIRRELGLAATDRIVLYQGVMNAGRGLAELIESARHFPEGVRLVMLGHGTLEAALRKRVQDSGLGDRVFLLGSVPQADLAQWTASADLGVLILDPINRSKRLALANKIFEYMAAGIPILATDLPENRRILDRCECGWLVPSKEPLALAEHVSKILEDRAEMRRRGANGRAWFEQRYNWDSESERLLAALDGLVPNAEGVGG